MNERGFTLLEALLAMALLGVVLAGLVPSFFAFLDFNTHSEERSGAVAAAQQILESLRHEDPRTLPSAGASPLEVVTVGQRDFEVIRRYCLETIYCGTDSRHVVVEVSYGGKPLFTAESVYTRLR